METGTLITIIIDMHTVTGMDTDTDNVPRIAIGTGNRTARRRRAPSQRPKAWWLKSR
jgi:hypothetical protein